MAARAEIHGLNLIWDPLIKRWILEDVNSVGGMLFTVWKNTDYDLNPKYKSTRQKPESTWIKHNGSYEVPEGLRDAKRGDCAEVWIYLWDNIEYRSLQYAKGKWLYANTDRPFEIWTHVTHYRRPQRPEDA